VLVQGTIVVQALILHRVHPFSVRLLKPLAAATVAFVVESAVRATVGPLGLRLPAVIAAGAATYVATLWALGLPPEERRLLRGGH
jgi:hypothetical protein